jgi:apolipoprotein N-acyltransferase
MGDTRPVPLAVDLDGTLLRTDMTWETLARLLRRNPFAIFQILFWWTRGRAWLKQKIAARLQIDPAALPYNEKFLAWLREEKKSGRKIILATASDLKMAQPVADHVGLFDEVLASDGKTNLRSENKLRTLTEKFGERGFDYAGNSDADFAVWRGSREAVVVNASRRVLREAANCTKLGPVFCDDYSALAVAKSFCTELFWRSGYLVAIVAGLLLAGAFPNFNCAGFAWVAPALLLFAARGQSGAGAFRAGCAGGLAFWLASLSWLLRIPATGYPILGWVALAAYLALFFGVWLWLISNFKFQISNWIQRLLWSLGGAAAWVALEMLRARLFGGFPWNLLGDSQFKLVPLLQIASVTGVYGVSFLVAWFALELFAAGEMIFRNPTRRHVWQQEMVLPLLVILGFFGGGYFAINSGSPSSAGLSKSPAFLRVTLIQPSVPQTLIWSASEDSKRFRELLDRSQRALTNQTDVLLWPESAVPALDDATYRAIVEFAQSNRVWIVFNGDDVTFPPGATNWFNSAFLMNPDGRLASIYHKRQLVIFGEYVPLTRWLPFLKWFTPIQGGWTAGDRPGRFEVERWGERPREPQIELDHGSPGVSPHQPVVISPLICFEDVFPGTVRDATDDDTDFLVNLTNDGWFGDSTAQWQHTAAAVFRAIENRRPLVRCANNGVTCWIDDRGNLRQILADPTGDVHRAGALTIEIPLPPSAEKTVTTFYRRHGDWFGWTCAGVTLFLLGRKFFQPFSKPSR